MLEGYLHTKLSIWNALNWMKRQSRRKNPSSARRNDKRYLFQPGHKVGTVKIHVEVKTTDWTSCKFGTEVSILSGGTKKTQGENLK